MITDESTISICQGCLKNIEQGEVVAFGQSLFHVACFICAKCKKCVDNKNNLLLLSDGRPLCEHCSYNCTQCQKVIHNEAILTGDQAYHSECFKCTSCNELIKDLIFTQTAEGIYCTLCNQSSDQTLFSTCQTDSNSCVTDSQEKLFSISTKDLFSKDSLFSDLTTLSFFNNDSSELTNLSNSLGANLFLDDSANLEESTIITQSRLNRASEILEKSLRTTSVILTTKDTKKPRVTTFDMNKLQQELMDSQLKLKEMEDSYKTLQEASQLALDEFNKIKEDYSREASIKKQMEYSILSLLKKNGGILSKKELDRLALFRLDLEKTCKEMISYRDKIAHSIDKNTILTTYQKSLKTQIKSLLQEREILSVQTKELKATRDEIIHDLMILNAKNTELANMNNDFSKLAFEKEQKENKPHYSPPLSPSYSSSEVSLVKRTRKTSDADSMYNVSPDQPNLARTIKKKGSTMFSKLSGTTASSSSSSNLATSSKSSLTPSSASIYRTVSQQSGLYQNHNSSVQSLSLEKTIKKSSSSSLLTDFECQQHTFQSTSFLRPVKCGVCNEKIWGRSEYRCDHCGFAVHSRCLNKSSNVNNTFDHKNNSSVFELPTVSIENVDFLSSCSLDKKSCHSIPTTKLSSSVENHPLFGVDLALRCEQENRAVPIFIEDCLREVEKRGLDYEGIYRKSGGAAQIRTIQQAYNHGDKINLSDEDEFNDLGAITSVLKQYFRDLPNPLLTHEHYDKFIEFSVMKNDEEKVQQFSNIFSLLPKAHFDTASVLFKHLFRVYQRSDLNRMTAKNLAMVFAPTLMRHMDQAKDFLDISYKNATIEFILLHTEQLFPTAA